MREANPNIRCTVNNCEYHCKDGDYCSLDKIDIPTHEMNPTKCVNAPIANLSFTKDNFSVIRRF